MDADTFLGRKFFVASHGESQENFGGFRGEVKMVVSRKALLGGGNSNIFHFHPENWGR